MLHGSQVQDASISAAKLDFTPGLSIDGSGNLGRTDIANVFTGSTYCAAINSGAYVNILTDGQGNLALGYGHDIRYGSLPNNNKMNVAIGAYNTIFGGTGTSRGNIAMGRYQNLTASGGGIIEDNCVFGYSTAMTINAGGTGQHNIIHGGNHSINMSAAHDFSYNAVFGRTIGITTTAGGSKGFKYNLVAACGIMTGVDIAAGYINNTAFLGNASSGVASFDGAYLYNSIIAGNSGMTSISKLSNSAVIGTSLTNITHTGASSWTRSAAIATSSLTSTNRTIDNSLFLGLGAYTIGGNLANTVVAPKMKLGRGTSGALVTTGETHMLAYNSANGDVVRAALPAAGGGAFDTTATLENIYPTGSSPVFSTYGQKNTLLTSDRANYNDVAGYSNILGFYYAKITDTSSTNNTRHNTLLSVYGELINDSAATGAKVKDNFITGYFSRIELQNGASTLNGIIGNTLLGSEPIISASALATNPHVYGCLLSGHDIAMNLTAATAKIQSSAILASDNTNINVTTASGQIRSSLVAASTGSATMSPVNGNISFSAMMGNQGSVITGPNLRTFLLGSETLNVQSTNDALIAAAKACTITAPGAGYGMYLSAVIGSSGFVNSGYNFVRSAIIGVETYTMTANIDHTVILPKLILGRGTSGALPTTGETHMLGYNSTTGAVVRTAIPLTNNFGAQAIKTIAVGVAAAGDDRNLIIAAESGTADDLIELTGCTVGDEVLLRADTGDTITVKDNDAGATIKIHTNTGADITLDEINPAKFVLVSTNILAQIS